MEIALIVGLSILLALSIGAIPLIYSYYIYSKNTIFTKIKPNKLWIIVCAIFAFILLGVGIFFIVDLNHWQATVQYDPIYIGLSFACFVFFLSFLISFILIPKNTNQSKISFENILKIDYPSKISQLLIKIEDVEKLKSSIAKKHKNYYQRMLFSYENILKRLKNEKISVPEKLADIVTFNETFAHKWCDKTNDYQLLLTYQFLALMQKFPKK